MATPRAETRPGRSLGAVVEDAITRLIQDASEYAFIGFVGATAALFVAAILRLTRNPIADATIAPAVFGIALLTMAAATIAFARAAQNLHPDAGGAMTLTATRAAALLQPWLFLSAAMFAGALGLGLATRWLGSWSAVGFVLLLVVWPALYSLPRSYYVAVLLTQQMSDAQAQAVAGELFRRAPGRVLSAWGLVLAPACAVALIGMAAGFGAASAGVTAFVFVALMPVAAAMLTLLFFEAAELARAQEGAGRRTATSPPSSASPAATRLATRVSRRPHRG